MSWEAELGLNPRGARQGASSALPCSSCPRCMQREQEASRDARGACAHRDGEQVQLDAVLECPRAGFGSSWGWRRKNRAPRAGNVVLGEKTHREGLSRGCGGRGSQETLGSHRSKGFGDLRGDRGVFCAPLCLLLQVNVTFFWGSPSACTARGQAGEHTGGCPKPVMIPSPRLAGLKLCARLDPAPQGEQDGFRSRGAPQGRGAAGFSQISGLCWTHADPGGRRKPQKHITKPSGSILHPSSIQPPSSSPPPEHPRSRQRCPSAGNSPPVLAGCWRRRGPSEQPLLCLVGWHQPRAPPPCEMWAWRR